MKKVKILAILSVLVLCCAMLAACNGISDHERAAAGKYNLTSISGTDSVVPSNYEYNYITLKTDGKFVMENKSQDVEFSASGKWNLDGETLSLKLSGLFTQKEKHTLAGGKLRISGTLDGKAVVMEYTLDTSSN